jgi:hypothetical protein
MPPKKRAAGQAPKGRDRPGAEEDTDPDDLVFEDPYEDEYDSEDMDAGAARGGGGAGRAAAPPSAAKSRGAAVAGEGSERRAAAKATAAGAGVPTGGSDDDEDDGEDDDEGDDDNEMEDEDDEDGEPLRVFRPGIDKLAPGEVLEVSNEAYVMLHNLEGQWPCLSFDVLPDQLGAARKAFPITAFFVCGSQADKPSNNRVSVMKASDLCKTQHDDGTRDVVTVVQPSLASLTVCVPCDALALQTATQRTTLTLTRTQRWK